MVPIDLPALKNEFSENGYVLLRNFVDTETTQKMSELTDEYLAAGSGPVEYEADLGYPGAPEDKTGPGGGTIRRFLDVVDRAPVFEKWARNGPLTEILRFLAGEQIKFIRAHHNCIMVKSPEYGSETNWHQDIRYWKFQKPELISTLLALNPASRENGCLSVIPGSHKLELEKELFDAELFFQSELPASRTILEKSISLPMGPGDLILFHCKTLHSAGRNTSTRNRKSLIFTYCPISIAPVPATRSAAKPELLLQ